MFQWLWNIVADEVHAVALPRFLVLRNKRLGIFHKILQFVGCIVIIMYSVYARVFMLESKVEAWAVKLWREDSPAQTVAGHTLPPCQDPLTYTSNIDGTFTYTPTACKGLPNEESHFIHLNKLFLATFIDDTLVWDGTGEQCGAASQQACQRNREAVYEETDGRCSCKFHEQFIVKNAEEQSVRFAYGFQVDLSNGKRMNLHQNGLLSSRASEGSQHNMKALPSTLVTRFLKSDGTDCTFGGKSQWQQSDAVGGISGTLNELLACAGLTLDSDPSKLVTGTVSSSPHLRTMGFELTLHMHLSQDLFGHTTSEIKVEATPAATVSWKDDIRSSASSRMGTVARRLRRAHGVAIDVHVRGQIFTFSWYQLVRGFVDVTVLLRIPSLVVQFVSMYLMGVSSEIYRHTARTKLNIFAKFPNAVAKLMLAEVAFRGLVGNFSARIEDLDALTPQTLLQRLKDVFLRVCHAGALQDEEVMKLACVAFKSMDTDSDGNIRCREFIEACTDDGEITMQRMAKFFHVDEEVHSLRTFLDDTDEVACQVGKHSRSLFGGNLETNDTCSTADSRPSLRSSALDAPANAKATQIDVDEFALELEVKTEAKIQQHAQQLKPTGNDAYHCLERTVANLERRLQAQEQHCEQALGLLQLRTSLHRSPRNCPLLHPRGGLCGAASMDITGALSHWGTPPVPSPDPPSPAPGLVPLLPQSNSFQEILAQLSAQSTENEARSNNAQSKEDEASSSAGFTL